jgi:PadR family transcriptional regulator, regulatory protein PadR
MFYDVDVSGAGLQPRSGMHRLIKRGWISVEVGTSENNRRAKFYRLTATGRRQRAVETSKWERLAEAIARILRPPAHEGKS